MRPQQKLLFLFYLKKILSYQEKETSKTDGIVNKPGAFEMRKYASFAEMNMILITITKT